VQDDLDLGLGAGDICELADRDTQSSTEKTTEVRSRVRKLVGLAVTLVEGDEDAHVVLAREDLDGGAGELGSDLIEATGSDTLLGAGDVEGAHGRMVRCLLRKIRC
jgi:hypothetical protein